MRLDVQTTFQANGHAGSWQTSTFAVDANEKGRPKAAHPKAIPDPGPGIRLAA